MKPLHHPVRRAPLAITCLSLLAVALLVLVSFFASPARGAIEATAVAARPRKGGAAAPAKDGPPPADSSPMADLKKANTDLRKVLQKKHPNWSPEAEADDNELRKIVGNFLDFEELARRSLAKHWDGLTAKQRADFVATLRRLVEHRYIREVYGQPEYTIKFDKETKQDREASVTANLLTSVNAKKVNMALEYKMLYKEGHWVVYDIITDDQSLLENYRAEFNKFINKESFDGLLKRLKKRLDDKDTKKG